MANLPTTPPGIDDDEAALSKRIETRRSSSRLVSKQLEAEVYIKFVSRDFQYFDKMYIVTSCIEKSEIKKRVNFYKEKGETTSYTSSSYYRLPQQKPSNDYSGRPSSSHRSTTTNDDSSLYNSISDPYDLHQCSGSSASPGHPRAGTNNTPTRKSSKSILIYNVNSLSYLC